MVILWLPTFWLSKILWPRPPPIFLSKIYDPPWPIFGTPDGPPLLECVLWLCCLGGGGHSYSCMCCHHQAGLQISHPKHWRGAGENSNPNHGPVCEMGTLFTDQFAFGNPFHRPVVFCPFGHPFHWLRPYIKKVSLSTDLQKKKKFNQSLSWINFLY